MPRGIGASVGVKESVTGAAVRASTSAQRLLDLRGVPVGAADLVGGHGAHHLAGEQVGAERAARARGAGGGHDHDVVGLDEPGREQRREREDRRGGVAAGGGDRAGGLDLSPVGPGSSSGRP